MLALPPRRCKQRASWVIWMRKLKIVFLICYRVLSHKPQKVQKPAAVTAAIVTLPLLFSAMPIPYENEYFCPLVLSGYTHTGAELRIAHRHLYKKITELTFYLLQLTSKSRKYDTLRSIFACLADFFSGVPAQYHCAQCIYSGIKWPKISVTSKWNTIAHHVARRRIRIAIYLLRYIYDCCLYKDIHWQRREDWISQFHFAPDVRFMFRHLPRQEVLFSAYNCSAYILRMSHATKV